MKADLFLTDDLDEAGVVPTIELGDHRLLGWTGDDVLVADVLIGGVTLAGQSGRIGSPRGKVDGYRRFHAGRDGCGAINNSPFFAVREELGDGEGGVKFEVAVVDLDIEFAVGALRGQGHLRSRTVDLDVGHDRRLAGVGALIGVGSDGDDPGFIVYGLFFAVKHVAGGNYFLIGTRAFTPRIGPGGDSVDFGSGVVDGDGDGGAGRSALRGDLNDWFEHRVLRRTVNRRPEL